ncbi:MAG: 50S ribosomal protein L25 [Candidatus Paceibacterota bacterium]
MEKLQVKKRNIKDDTNEAREAGVLPAVMYGRDTDSTPIAVGMTDFIKLWHQTGTSTVFQLEIKDDKTQPALIQDIDIHPVTDEPIHADIYVIEKGQTVTVDLPVEIVGTAPAIKNKGGLLVRILHSVEVEADPTKLPSNLEVDVSGLEDFGSQVTVADITVPDGVEILAEDEEVVVLIEEPTELEELEPEEEGEEFDFDDIEVEGERKKEDEEGEGGEEGEGDEQSDEE